MTDGTYRLITRSDFDGLVCAVLLKELGMVADIKFVHPKDMQDGTVLVTANDLTTNLPYVHGVHLAFDHHLSETIRLDEMPDNYIIDPKAPSAARVVYDHFGGGERFPGVSEELMAAVDKGDSGQFTEDDILNPGGWVLLTYLMDSRTGLGRFHDFRISNYDLMMSLIDACRTHEVEEILALPDVKERVDLYRDHQERAKDQIKRCTKITSTVGVLDPRGEDPIYVINRFMVYALMPEIAVSIHVLWGLNKLSTVLAVGKSVLNRESKVNIGAMMLEFDGGGHENAGTCQVGHDEVDQVLEELVGRIAAGE